MDGYTVRALTRHTWDAFAALCERNNGGGMGGCWCCWFHNSTKAERARSGGDDWRGYKERLVLQGKAHAALVFDETGRSAGANTVPSTNYRAFSTAVRWNPRERDCLTTA